MVTPEDTGSGATILELFYSYYTRAFDYAVIVNRNEILYC
jgi:hypothetical protein